MHLDGAMLFVKDLDRMTAFYRDILQLQPVEDRRLDNWVEFKGDGARFSLHAIPPAIAASIHIDSPPRPREQGGIKLTFIVRDVHSTLERITAMGLPLLRRPGGAPTGSIPKATSSPSAHGRKRAWRRGGARARMATCQALAQRLWLGPGGPEGSTSSISSATIWTPRSLPWRRRVSSARTFKKHDGVRLRRCAFPAVARLAFISPNIPWPSYRDEAPLEQAVLRAALRIRRRCSQIPRLGLALFGITAYRYHFKFKVEESKKWKVSSKCA